MKRARRNDNSNFKLEENGLRRSKNKRKTQESLDAILESRHILVEINETNEPNALEIDSIVQERNNAIEFDVPMTNENFEYNDSFGETVKSRNERLFVVSPIASQDKFNQEDALNYISSVFLKNNISKNLGKDIFSLAKLISLYPSIKISDVQKRIESWGNHEKRVYSYCCSCDHLLPDSQKCRNKDCHRFSVPQSNVAGNKTIVTFSIREQLEHLLKNNVFDSSLLNNSPPSLCTRLRDTPKYQKRMNDVKIENPEIITLLISLNTDGFRKRGSKRGEFWPLFLAVHDVSKGGGNFREYRPEFVILSSMLQSSKKLNRQDFASAFQRMFLEIESIRKNPMKVTIEDVTYPVVLELYQSVLDLDASRKIHGVPVWQSFNSCSRCTVKGTSIKLKKGRKICWYSADPVSLYDRNNYPEKYIHSCLPPPWEDGFDGLHLVYEGTSRDLLKDLLGKGKKTGRRLKSDERKKWAHALSNATQAKGTCSAALLDPILLSTRTGSEVQQIYDISIPTLVMCINKSDLWTVMVMLHWLTTRVITDDYLCLKQCENLKSVSFCLREIVGNRFKSLYSMKFHFVHDHMVPTLANDGSPLLTSAAPFERLNQVLGRASNTYTTRATVNMATRFIGLQEASFCCGTAIGKTDSPVTLPFTLRAERESISTPEIVDFITDDFVPLTDAEKEYFAQRNVEIIKMRSTCRVKNHNYSNRISSSSIVKASNVFFFNSNKRIQFGSIERIFVNFQGEQFILLQQFEIIDPFGKIEEWAISQRNLSQKLLFPKVFSLCRRLNSYFFKIISAHFEIIEVGCLEGYCNVLEFDGNSYVSRC